MKKIKMVLVLLAIMIAIGGSFATAPCETCESYTQYYRDGNYYYPAGSYGDEYICEGTIGTCTYWRPNPVLQPFYYVPCRTGYYTPVW
jgi:hypothetical protein